MHGRDEDLLFALPNAEFPIQMSTVEKIHVWIRDQVQKFTAPPG